MSTDNFNVGAYLERINYTGKLDVSYETLYGLHTAHTLNVPFENLDVFYHKPILLDKESLFNKIVVNRRGGYCFEMNGLFAFVLEELGFKVTNLLTRGTRDGINYGAKLHQILLVEIDGKRYIADVGYGNDGITAPVEFVMDVDQKQFTHTYKIVESQKYGYQLLNKIGDTYRIMYAFTLEECIPADFLMSNHFTATYPESFFRKMKMCTIPTLEGRITLTDMHLKILRNGEITERDLSGDDEYNEFLKEYYKLDLDLIK